MNSKNTFQNPLAEHPGKTTTIDNLIKNGEFLTDAEHWAVTDFGVPENCVIGNSAAQLKNNGSIAQSVQVERATPYTLRFSGLSIAHGAGIAQVIEQGVVTQTYAITAEFERYVKPFVTRENTSSLVVQFTGTQDQALYVQSVMLTKDIPNPEELVKNGDFDFGRENWTVTGQPLFQAGTCEPLLLTDYVSQRISGLTVGATYRITCTTLASPSFLIGYVHLRPSGAERLTIFTLSRDMHEYSYEYQVLTNEISIELQGQHAVFDSISVKRISVSV